MTMVVITPRQEEVTVPTEEWMNMAVLTPRQVPKIAVCIPILHQSGSLQTHPSLHLLQCS